MNMKKDVTQSDFDKPVMGIIQEGLGEYLTDESLASFCLGVITPINLTMPVLRVAVSRIHGLDKSVKDIMSDLEKALMYIHGELSEIAKSESD